MCSRVGRLPTHPASRTWTAMHFILLFFKATQLSRCTVPRSEHVKCPNSAFVTACDVCFVNRTKQERCWKCSSVLHLVTCLTSHQTVSTSFCSHRRPCSCRSTKVCLVALLRAPNSRQVFSSSANSLMIQTIQLDLSQVPPMVPLRQVAYPLQTRVLILPWDGPVPRVQPKHVPL